MTTIRGGIGSAAVHGREFADGFIKFVNSSPSPFHAVANAVEKLQANGYKMLCEKQAWKSLILPGGKYIVTRNGSALVAFAVGIKFGFGSGFSIIGAHTDSPCLKVKPCSAISSTGYLQVGVQTYGGGLWHTWFDRDLGLAGRVVLRSSDKKSVLEERLVCLPDPILRIPSLAIHLDSSVKDSFKFNNETHLLPLLGSCNNPNIYEKNIKCQNDIKKEAKPRHHDVLIGLLAEKSDCKSEDISDVELCLYDIQSACIGGICGEYVFSPRCDNLVMSYCALEALCRAGSKNGTEYQGELDPKNIALVALFDNEEVGSLSCYGAQSWFLPSMLRRIFAALQPPDAFEQSIAKSLVISADMAHAVHPNYNEKHEALHRPLINGGVVIKHNANQRYATTAKTSALVRALAERAGVPIQDFVVRNDSPCGTTIGPILAGAIGVRCVDVGNPQLSMHSIREQAGVLDFKYAIDLFTTFFTEFSTIDGNEKN